jgi:hypothetical protein
MANRNEGVQGYNYYGGDVVVVEMSAVHEWDMEMEMVMDIDEG